jgi:NAD(P)-dependent dehydrogenase (short-subunit alcohol dehydrogenase family)
MKRHEGKTMLVTGAAGAIGFATSTILAREGAKVMLVDIDGRKLEERIRTLHDAGYQVIGHEADCADEAQVIGYAEAAIDKLGQVDGFFNNAGIEGDLAPTHLYKVEEFDRVLHVNLRGMFLGLRYVLPDMVRRGTGAVVNTASIGSERGPAPRRARWRRKACG